MATVLEELHKVVERLPFDHQQRVLEFAQRLTQTSDLLSAATTPLPPGTPANALLHQTAQKAPLF